MKKSTHTPDPATPDQAPEHGSGREVTVPTGPKKIITALNRRSYLHFHSDNYIRITSEHSSESAFWVFNYSEQKGAYKIQCFPFFLYMTGTSAGKVIATGNLDPGTDPDGQFWRVTDAGDGFVYIQNVAYLKVLDVSRSSTEEDTQVYLGTRIGTSNQKFMIGVDPA